MIFNMEGYALGYMKDGERKLLGDKDDTEKNEQDETNGIPALEAVMQMMEAGMFSSGSKWNAPWLLFTLLLLIGAPKPNSEADYWRGKYDALRELCESDDE